MKKKVLGILSCVFMLFVCLTLSSCKGKYDKMQFQVLYAFSEDAETWLDGSNGIDVYYGQEEGLLPQQENGWAKLYIKIQISKVKSKYIDDIFVSSSTSNGMYLSNSKVKSGEVFSVEVKDKVSFVLSALETVSQKGTSVNVNASFPLEKIETNFNVNPAVVIGNSINLNEFNALTFYPINKTNQTSVNYEIKRVGYFINGEENNQFVGTANISGVSINNNILSLDSNFNFNAERYAIEIEAKSTYNANISSIFYVYAVTNDNNIPTVKYYNDNGLNNAEIDGNIMLYSGTKYSTASLIVGLENVNEVYKTGKYLLHNGVANIETQIFANKNSEPVNVQAQTQQEDLKFGLHFGLGSANNVYTITATSLSYMQDVVVDFKLAFSLLNFGSFNFNSNAKSITIQKGSLATGIKIGDNFYKNGENAEFEIYATNGKTNAVTLNLAAVSASNPLQKIYISKSNNLTVTPLVDESNPFVYTNGYINVNFTNSDNTGLGSIQLSTYANPETFQGLQLEAEPIVVNLQFKKIISANGFAVFKDNQFQTKIENRELLVGVGEENFFYLRVYYSNGEFNNESAKSVIINAGNEGVLLTNNGLTSNELTLNNVSEFGRGHEDNLGSEFYGDDYVQYRIAFANVDGSAKATNISITSGAGTLNMTSFNAVPVTISNGQFDVATSIATTDAVRMNNSSVANKHFYFATVFNKTINFDVFSNENNLGKDVNKLTIINQDNSTFENSNFTNNAVELSTISNYSFQVKTTTAGQTRVVKLAISYYYYDQENGCVLLRNDYDNRTPSTNDDAEILTLEFAVFVPITGFQITPNLSTLNYINKNIATNGDFSKYTQAEISYKAISNSITNSPTKVIYFTFGSGFVEENPNKIDLLFSQNIDHNSLEIFREVNGVRTAINVSSLTLDELEGKIVVLLRNESNISSLKLTFSPKIFNEIKTDSQSATINFQTCAAAQGVTISGENIINRVENSNYVTISFIDSMPNGSVSKQFFANAYYRDEDRNKLQLGLLDYSIENVNDPSIASEGISLTFENGVATISATNNGKNGGLYRISIFAPDSYVDNGTDTPYYSAINYVYLEISDGGKVSPYVLSSEADFAKIRNNNSLDKTTYYVLGADFTVNLNNLYSSIPESERFYEFFGNLSGNYVVYDANNVEYNFRYTITVILNSKVYDNLNNNYIGLFPKINNEAVVANLNLDVEYQLNDVTTSVGNVYIGGLAGVNDGTITNVDVNLKYNTNINLSNLGEVNLDLINFGGLVGQNSVNGKIDMQNSAVNCSRLIIYTKDKANLTHNIGLIAGENNSIIQGEYAGKPSLNNVAYTVVANLSIVASGRNAKINAGAVAGASGVTDRAGNVSLIQNVIVGGRISLDNAANNETYLGGIIGYSNNSTGVNKGIYTCAVLGLDLTNNSANGYVAGIAAALDNSTIDDVRIMSTYAKFNGFNSTGKISGANVVAGVVAKLSSSRITNASVESFIDAIDNETFYMLESATNNVYGLAYDDNTNSTISSCFINANIKNVNNDNAIYLTSNSNSEEYSYFLGKINGILDNLNIVKANANCSYSVVLDGDNMFYFNHISSNLEKCNEENLQDWLTFVKSAEFSNLTWEENNATNFKLDENKNIIKIGDVNYYFPYLVNNFGEPQMIERPSSIKAAFNSEYALYTNSHIVQSGNLVLDMEQIKNNLADIIFVNYFEFEDKSKNSESYNTHNLVNTNKENPNGLIDLEVLPNGTQGGVSFEILNILGFNNARIINSAEGHKIVFSAASGNLPIIVRAYSIFNPEAQCFVAMFSQNGISKLNISSTSTRVNEVVNQEVDYELTTYTNSAPLILNFEAENMFKGQKFKTIFDNLEDYSNYISIDWSKQDIGYEGEILTLNETTSKTSIQLEVGNDFDGYYFEEIITFSLKIDLQQYILGNGYEFNLLEGVEDAKYELAQVKLRVMVFKSTEKIEPNIEAKTLDSETPIALNVTLKTSYVEADEDNTLKNGGSKALSLLNILVDGQSINLNEQNKDSLILTFNKNKQNSQALQNLLQASGCDYVTDLFNLTNVTYKFYYENETINGESVSTLKGYVYTIEIELKQGYEFRHLIENVGLTLTINSTTNPNPSLDKLADLQPEIELTLTPTDFKSARIYNYAATDMQAAGTTNIVTSNSLDSNYISPAPNSYGSILAIHLQPNYSIIRNATLSSNSIKVPSLSNPVYLILTQVVPVENGLFQSIISKGGSTLTLNTSPEYVDNGIIYVHAEVSESFSGYSAPLTLTLTAEVGSVEQGTNRTITIEKQLLTTYLPGVYLSYNQDAKVPSENAYFIEEDSYYNTVGVTLYGYELQSSPNVYFVWNLSSFDNIPEEKRPFNYLTEGNYVDYSTIVDKNGKQYKIGDYVDHSDLNNFTNLHANRDGSFSFNFNVQMIDNEDPIPASFKLIAEFKFNENGDGDSKELVFYPVNYVFASQNAAYLSNMSNGNVYANVSALTPLEFVFKTTNADKDKSIDIYLDILKSFGYDGLDENKTAVAISKLKHAFSFTGTMAGYFDDENITAFKVLSQLEINKNEKNEKDSILIVLQGVAENQFSVTFRLNYAYIKENGMYKIAYGTENNFTGTNSLEFRFNLVIRVQTNLDAPIPLFHDNFVSKINEFAGSDFILMEDVELEDFTPISTNIASLDGNNKVIKIKSFAVSPDRTEYGLFANIGTFESGTETKTTILKNIIVDYSECVDLRLLRNTATEFVFGGLVATNNGGLIYNCDVMNINANNRTKDLNIYVSSAENANADNSILTLTFGGLVGVNSGNITNSRVGRLSYTKINCTIEGSTITESSDTDNANPINFILGKNLASSEAQSFKGIAGGFVGVNSGIIASSYFANAGLVNYSAVADHSNKTAGFVAENSGEIRFSYVKALENSINSGDATSAKIRCTGAAIEGKGNSNIAGFVYTNSSIIENCFANTELKTTSSYSAGFVYENLNGAEINMCYAACSTSQNNIVENALNEQPFVGVNAENTLLSNGKLSNCYYLEETGSIYTLPNNLENLPQAVALNAENFSNQNNLNNFVFIKSDYNESIRNQGVWTYYPVGSSQKHILPELTSANIVAHSYRMLMGEENNVYQYTYSTNYSLGGVNNPYTISNANEFNLVFAGEISNNSHKKENSIGYFRMINNINFENVAILTRSNFMLGDDNNLTSFEGNGMTISNIYLDVLNLVKDEGGNALEKVGLFAEMNNTYFKNVNLEYISLTDSEQNPTVPIKYSGGLAGVIKNSAIINVKLVGNNTTIAGSNFVGGVAGLVSGTSFIYNVSSNLGAVSDSYPDNSLYYNEADYTKMQNNNLINRQISYNDYTNKLSYAGGIAGVLDLQTRENLEYNISNVDVYGNNMTNRTSGNIVGNFAGGIAGFASADTVALKLRFYVGTSTSIVGLHAAGGLYGVGVGRGKQNVSLTASQVTEEENIRYSYDTNYGNYIINLEKNGSASLSNTGNQTLLTTEGFAGGLVGISIAQTFESCYAKSSVNTARDFGGTIGLSVGSTLSHVYAVPYVNLTNNLITNVGGLIGVGYGINNSATSYSTYTNYAKYLLNINDKNTDVIYTFSTLLIDNNQLSQILAGEIVENGQTVKIMENGKFVKNINYLAGQYLFNNNKDCFVNSNNSLITNGNLSVYVGKVNNYAKIEDTNVINHTVGEAINLSELFNLEDVDQPVLFKNMFGEWPTRYWLLDNEKYFPLLIKEDVLNYIIIDEYTDFDILVSNPDKNFKIVKDINMAEWSGHGNWIFDINFTGTLIGEPSQGNTAIPTVYNLHVETTLNDRTAGLFMQTTGATIKDINWVWTSWSTGSDNGAIDDTNTPSLTTIGGVSCEDYSSKFNNLNVYVGSYTERSSTPQSSLNPYLINNLDEHKITGFGGIVGIGENSSIENCSFNGKIKANLNNAGENVYFGGIAGRATKNSAAVDNFGAGYQKRSIIMNSSVGNHPNFNTQFDITLGKNSKSFVGGAIGYVYNSAINNVNVGEINNFKLNVNLYNFNSIMVAGLIGYEQNSSITDSNAIGEINFLETINNEEETNGSLYAAGLVSQAEQSVNSTDSGFINSSANVNINLTKLNITNVYVSGGIASASSASTLEIRQCVFAGKIYSEQENANSSEGEENSTAWLKNVYAAGVVAVQSGISVSGNLSLKETVSATDITIGTALSQDTANTGTTTIYMGGFVGKANGNVTLQNSITIGKCVPITSRLNENDGGGETEAYNIYIGGFVGYADKVNFANSISTTSIIADSINSLSIRDLHIHALLGDIASKDSNAIICNNVFYSSDIALFPEDLCLTASNRSAVSLTKNSAWQSELITSGYWTNTTTNAMLGLPTLSNGNIIDKLRSYNVLIGQGNSGVQYSLGSAANPEMKDWSDIKTNGSALANKFYILQDAGQSDEQNIIDLSGVELNGVLIAVDSVFTITESNASQQNGYAGIFSQIMPHSAISNLHVNVVGNLQINADKAAGIIAGYNSGVMFNCSVQGSGINVGGSNLGLIAGRNAGLVSYCFSSAEIVSTSTNVSGIVYSNVDKILSCYFTGYIDNSINAVGIVMENSTGSTDVYEQGKTPYVYNCYMAGVIVNVQNNNAFVGDTNGLILDNKAIGSRNYVDINVNGTEIEQKVKASNNAGKDVICLSTIDTHILMANTDKSTNILEGNWLTAAETRLWNSTEQYYINIQATSYGYNYLYPVYNFNKITANGNNTDYIKLFQLYTGTGGDGYVLDLNFKSNHDVALAENQKSNKDCIIEGPESGSDYYLHALKIPHLGVLKAVQGIATTFVTISNSPELFFPDLNYVLIYDINGKFNSTDTNAEDYEWTAVGSQNSNGFMANFGKSIQFNGLFVSNKYYNYGKIEANSKDNLCTIQNLANQGLFDNINRAYFGYFILGNFTNLKNSGALGVAVHSQIEEQTVMETVVENVYFQEAAIYTAADTSDNYISAMFGEVGGTDNDGSTANIKIKSCGFIKSDNANPNYVTLANGNYMGLIVGKFTNGYLEFKEGNIFAVNFAAKANKNSYAGGVVGLMENGTIAGAYTTTNNSQTKDDSNSKTTNTIITIANLTTGNQLYLDYSGGVKQGGIVGIAAKNSNLAANNTSEISGIEILLPNEYFALGFGGLIYENNNSHIKFANVNIGLTDSTQHLTLTLTGSNNFFGFVAAEMNAEDKQSTTLGVEVENFKFNGSTNSGDASNASSITVEVKLQNRGKFTSDKIEIDTQGFGGLVGALRGGFIKFSTGDAGFKPNLKVRSANVGGIVGCYSGGLIGIENSNNNYYVTLSGYYNVGGAIGYFAAGSLNNLLLGDKNSRWNFLNNSSAFAEINSFDKADLSADNYFANWGGLIGYFNSFENLSIAPDVSDGEKSDGIVNNNNIYIGTMEHDTSSNKTVSANPVLENVGGVIGKVSADEQINISYLTNNGEINEVKQQGNNDIGNVYHKFEQDEEIYLVKFSAKSKTQNDNYIFALLATNVGGVVGKLENATISNLSAKGSTVFGYKNVGGLIGYAYNVYTSENISVGANAVVVGVINVGGAIGEVSYDKNVEIKSGNGICNVNVEKGAKIYGNYNVGGLVGFLVNGTIENCTVGAEVKTNGNQSGQEVQADTQEPSQDANQNVTIKGIYFAIINFATSEYSGFTEADGTNINKEACFFPTNVGGLIGSTQAGQNVETKLFIIANNKLNNIIISSSLEGQVAIAESSEQTSTSVPVYNESTVISTISNAVLNENVTNNLSTLVQNRTDKGKFKSTIVSTYLQDFETAKTGFGGFIGSTEASAMLTTANQNVMSNVKIDASLGINVGSFYGYYNANKSYDVNNSLRTIITPKLNGDVSVTGAYFVGGIAGSIKAEDETISFNSNTKAGDISTDNSTPPTIYIQTGEYNIGMYVGGLFGNLNGKANGLKIDNSNGNSIQFRINNINSFYTGGLIGRLEGVLGDKDTSIDTNIVNAIYKQKVGDNSVETNKGGAFALIDYTESKTDSDANGNATKEPIDIKSSQATENFGGLVGMLKKPKISNIPDIDPSTAYVIGWHPYAFTVNTIENENYQDGKTNYDYEDGIEDSVYLTAQAYYVNQDNFEISYSRGGAEVGDDVEYSYTYDGIYDNVNSTSIWFNQNSNSPLNENCFGWAKDYTMFKIMQRRIPQGTNGNTAEWDSIATVYDASRISTVLTLTNAFTCDAKDSRKIPYSYKKVIDPENPENPPKYEMATSLFENYDKNGNGNIGNLVEILDKNEKDEDKKELADFANHIFYTIYETSDFESGSELSEPILYSRMGIARMLRDENNKPAENPKGRAVYYYNGDLKNDNYNDNIKNDSKSLTSWGGVVYYEIDDNFEDTSLTSFDFSSNLFDIFIDQNFEEWNIKDSSLNKLYFLNFASEDNAFESITEYWPPPGEDEPYLKYPVTIDFEDRIPMDTLCNIRNSKNKYDVQDNTGAVNQTLEFELNTEFIYLVNLNRGDEVLNNKKWFKFETIFQNPTSSSLTNVDSPDYSSKDGNILNVNGFVSSALYNELNKESSKTFHIENNTGLLTGVFIVLGGLIGLLGLLAGPWWIAVIGVAAGIIAGGITGHFVGIGEYNRLVNKYKNKVIANDIIMDKTFTRNGLSYGLFGETFNRELYYEYDEATESYVLKAQPETYKTINGEQYVYYSSTRPRTFYDEYYILRNIDENKEPIKVPKSEVTPDGNGVYTYKGTKYSGIADKDGYVMTKNFEYRNGVYYINLYGTAIENIPYQYPFNSNGYNESHYVDANGTIYAQGKATLNEDGSISYTLPKVEQKVDGSIGSKNKLYLEGNLIKNISSNENYKGITETEFMQKFSGITFRYKRRMYYKKIDESEISSHSDNFIVRAGQTPGLEENRYYFGYGYMKNAYYTALSNVKTDDKKQGYFVLVGFTDNVGTYNGEKCYGEFGIDYLQKQITITSQHSDGTSDKYNITAYYQFVGTSNETIQDSLTEYNEIDKANVTYQPIINEEHYSSSPLTIECKDINNKHFSIKDILLRKANCLQVGLYPHSFENPYTNTNEAIPYEYLTSESNNLTQKEANVNLSLEGTQDENYYIAISIESENIPNEDLNNYVIKNDVEYFYYEGDYVAYSTNYLSESFTNKYDYEYSGNLKLDDNGNGVVFKHYANISNIKLSKEGEDSKQHQYNETNHGHEIDDGWQVESFIYSSQFSDESDSVTKIKQLDNNNDFLKKYKVDIVENYTKEKIESKLSIDLATLALKFADYKSWYVYDESIDPEKINVDLFKVSNMFYVKYGGRATTDYYELYMRDDDVSVNSGILSKSWADTGGGDDDYNRNKFLMNKEYQIYTRYKFEDNIPVNALQGYSGKIFQNGCWSVIDNATPQYYLYLKGSSYPNKEKTNTYFVESLLVTLGGNVDVTCDVNNITTHSGSFTAK